MIKKIFLVFLITLAGINSEIVRGNSQTIDDGKNFTDEISNKKRELKRYRRDLKSLKKNNAPKNERQKLETKIKNTEQEIKNLTKKQRTSNTFFKRKSDIEARTTFDVGHGQDIYSPIYYQLKEPSIDPHEKLGGYFRNH